MAAIKECEAASSAVGWRVLAFEVDAAIKAFKTQTLPELQKRLRNLNSTFESNGGRGVDLADELDMLRIAIAARKVREENG